MNDKIDAGMGQIGAKIGGTITVFDVGPIDLVGGDRPREIEVVVVIARQRHIVEGRPPDGYGAGLGGWVGRQKGRAGVCRIAEWLGRQGRCLEQGLLLWVR